MKKEGRVKLYCTKQIREGVTDSFTVVVSKGMADTTKRIYEANGYKVTKESM